MPSDPFELASLARAHDSKSRDTYVSLYVDLADKEWQDTIDERAFDIRAAMVDEEVRTAFDESMKLARKELDRIRHHGKGVAIFSSAPHKLLVGHSLPTAVPTRLVADSGPYVRPLARFADEHEAFALVLLDGSRGVVYLVDVTGSHKEASSKMDLIGRHTKGGWSQMRYQRHRQGRVDQLLDDIGEQVDRLVRDGEATRVILAGPGQAKVHLKERLPAASAAALIAVEDADLRTESDEELIRRFAKLAQAEEAETSAEAAKQLRTSVVRGELSASGPFNTVRAARDGRIALLLILKDHKAGGRKCEAHSAYFATEGTCPVCKESGTAVDLANEAVEHALRSDARVEFVAKDAFLHEVGGMGALLRW